MLQLRHSPCQTDVQWKKVLGRMLRNHLELWRGTAVISWDGPSRGKMLVQHDMHLLPGIPAHLALLPRVSVALFPNRVPEIACPSILPSFSCKDLCTPPLSFPSLGNCLFLCIVAMPGLTDRHGTATRNRAMLHDL